MIGVRVFFLDFVDVGVVFGDVVYVVSDIECGNVDIVKFVGVLEILVLFLGFDCDDCF